MRRAAQPVRESPPGPRSPRGRQARAVYRRLLAHYGPPEREPLDPVSELVCTILSQNTSDLNRDRAFAQLRARFRDWDAVRTAPLDALREAIRPAGLAAIKAPRIQQALEAVRARAGTLDLDFLRALPLEEARAWLTGLSGVGPKTAAIILLFSLDRPAFPVDTHVHRVSGRLGLIGPRVSAEQAHTLLEALIPPERYLAYHLLLITHGRQICQARRPKCEVCPLSDLCDYARGASEAR
jgi:endonuclease-3